MHKKSKLKKWVIRIVVAIAVIIAVPWYIFIGAIVYEVITDPSNTSAPVVLTTADALPGFDRRVILHSALEAAGYAYERPWLSDAPVLQEITHHIYVGQLEDSYIFVMVRHRTNIFGQPTDISNAIVHGRLKYSDRDPQMRRFINGMRNEDGASWDEIREIYTPYFIEVSRLDDLQIVE